MPGRQHIHNRMQVSLPVGRQGTNAACGTRPQINSARSGGTKNKYRHYGRSFESLVLPQANKSPTVMEISPIRAEVANIFPYWINKVICFPENDFYALFFNFDFIKK